MQDLKFIAFRFSDFYHTDLDELFEPAIKQIDAPRTGCYKPNAKLKKAYNRENNELDVIQLCDIINRTADDKDAAKLELAEILSDVFEVKFNSNDEDLDEWKWFTLERLIDFLKMLSYVYKDNNYHNDYLDRLNSYIVDVYGTKDILKHFNFADMTVADAITTMMYEANVKLSDAQCLAAIEGGSRYDKQVDDAQALVNVGYGLIQELILNSAERCTDSPEFGRLILENFRIYP